MTDNAEHVRVLNKWIADGRSTMTPKEHAALTAAIAALERAAVEEVATRDYPAKERTPEQIAATLAWLAALGGHYCANPHGPCYHPSHNEDEEEEVTDGCHVDEGQHEAFMAQTEELESRSYREVLHPSNEETIATQDHVCDDDCDPDGDLNRALAESGATNERSIRVKASSDVFEALIGASVLRKSNPEFFHKEGSVGTWRRAQKHDLGPVGFPHDWSAAVERGAEKMADEFGTNLYWREMGEGQRDCWRIKCIEVLSAALSRGDQ